MRNVKDKVYMSEKYMYIFFLVGCTPFFRIMPDYLRALGMAILHITKPNADDKFNGRSPDILISILCSLFPSQHLVRIV